MSFRKRNKALSNTSDSSKPPPTSIPKVQLPGVKPSAIDGRLVTSTGVDALDKLLAGHGGLALGCSLLIEENGATDYAGALLKYYAAEGILQGHHVHVLGLPESWGRELPGAAGESSKPSKSADQGDKMKIAWRYESLGQFGASTAGSREPPRQSVSQADPSVEPSSQTAYNHTFDLTKRLSHPANTRLTFHPFSPTATASHSPFTTLLASLKTSLQNEPNTPHRLIIPSLLSPLLYPPTASSPSHLLTFLHTIRSLLNPPNSLPPLLTIITTLPLPLSPRSTGLTRWIELLHDGVIELSPFPHSTDTLFASKTQAAKTAAAVGDEPPQGLLKVHRMPVLTDRASGVRAEEGGADDWAFTLTRRRFGIKPWRLGPVEGDEGVDEGGVGGGGHEHAEGKGEKGTKGRGKGKKEGMEF